MYKRIIQLLIILATCAHVAAEESPQKASGNVGADNGGTYSYTFSEFSQLLNQNEFDRCKSRGEEMREKYWNELAEKSMNDYEWYSSLFLKMESISETIDTKMKGHEQSLKEKIGKFTDALKQVQIFDTHYEEEMGGEVNILGFLSGGGVSTIEYEMREKSLAIGEFSSAFKAWVEEELVSNEYNLLEFSNRFNPGEINLGDPYDQTLSAAMVDEIYRKSKKTNEIDRDINEAYFSEKITEHYREDINRLSKVELDDLIVGRFKFFRNIIGRGVIKNLIEGDTLVGQYFQESVAELKTLVELAFVKKFINKKWLVLEFRGAFLNLLFKYQVDNPRAKKACQILMDRR